MFAPVPDLLLHEGYNCSSFISVPMHECYDYLFQDDLSSPQASSHTPYLSATTCIRTKPPAPSPSLCLSVMTICSRLASVLVSV